LRGLFEPTEVEGTVKMKELVIEIDFNLWKHVLASNEVYSQIRDHFIEFVEGVTGDVFPWELEESIEWKESR